MKYFRLILMISICSSAFGQAQLIKEIADGPDLSNSSSYGSELWVGPGGSTSSYCEFKGAVYFSAISWATGRELFKTDGTKAGTKLFIDLLPGQVGSRPASLTVAGDLMFFTATAEGGQAIWVTDGTVEGTKRVTPPLERVQGVAWSDGPFITSSGRIYFSAQDTEHGLELWTSDGTAEGTYMLKDINPGAPASEPVSIHRGGAVNGGIVFMANDGVHGLELWKTDGTSEGTEMVGDFHPGAEDFYSLNYSTRIVSSNGATYFIGNDGDQGNQVWKTDGTLSGTVMMTDDVDDQASDVAIVFNDVVVFTKGSTTSTPVGPIYYMTDGSDAGTFYLTETFPTFYDYQFAVYDDQLYFVGNDYNTGNGVWRTDGTNGGTELVYQGDQRSITGLRAVEDRLIFFQSTNGPEPYDFVNHTAELWASDGTPEGTSLVKPVRAVSPIMPTDILSALGKVFFNMKESPYGDEPAVSDGTVEGTFILADINTEPPVTVTQLTPAKNTLYFVGNDFVHGQELWRSDGTSEGTHMVREIAEGLGRNDITQMTVLNDLIVFIASDGNSSHLWCSDGTEAGTFKLSDSNAGILFNSDGFVYFSTNGQLWKTDGTLNGTMKVSDTTISGNWINAFKETFYFMDNTYTFLQKFDKTTNTGVNVKQVYLASSVQGPGPLIAGENLMFFGADDDGSGRELWVSDGTTEGTKEVMNFTNLHDNMDLLAVVNDIVYFWTAVSGTDYELWRSDGTGEGTYLIKDINPGPSGSNPNFRYSDGTRIYFEADDGVHGRELWVSDGTPEGTVLLNDIVPGSGTATISSIIAHRNSVYFLAEGGDGAKLWKTNGTPGGTSVVTRFHPSPGLFSASSLVIQDDKFFFSAIDETAGSGLWAFDPILHQTIAFEPITSKTFGDQPFEISATATSGLDVEYAIIEGPVTLDGNTITITGAGNVTVKASQNGNDDFEPVSVETSFTIVKAAQQITFNDIADMQSNDAPFELAATSSSGLPVTFEIASGPATISGNTLTIAGAGEVMVRATQAGNDNYEPASAEQTFTVELFVGLEDKPDGVEIFPNPATSRIVVNATSFSVVFIKDIVGRDVATANITGENTSVDVTHLPRGMYIVQVVGSNTSVTRKILLM